MAQSYGLSFQPQADANGNGASATPPVQQAVKLLSLRLPSVVGARAIAPQALLESPGSAGAGGPGGMTGDALVAWLKKLLQQSQAPVPPQAQSVLQPSMSQVPTFGPSAGGGGVERTGAEGSGATAMSQPRLQVPLASAPPSYSAPGPPRVIPGGEVPIAPSPIPEGPVSVGGKDGGKEDVTPRVEVSEPPPSPFDYAPSPRYDDYQNPFDIF